MTNKTTKICCTLALLASVAATPAFSQTTNFTGPSLAFTGSFIGSSSKNDATVEGFTLLANTPGKRNDFIPGADFKYGFATSNNTVVGLGVTYDFSKLKTGGLGLGNFFGEFGEDASIVFNNELKNHYSIYIQPTYVINKDSAMFAKIGRHFAKAKFSATETNESGESTVTESFTNTKNITGWGYGLGLTTFLTSNLFVQAEAGIVDYEDFNFPLDDFGVNVSSKPKTINGTISVGYKF